jgi:hypothetical protein
MSTKSIWRVHYHLWAAGGRLIPTSRTVAATSEADALERASATQRLEDHRRGRANCGHFNNATAEAA